MTTPADIPAVDGPNRAFRSSDYALLVVCIVLSVCIAIASIWAASDSLGLFFGPVLLLTIVLPAPLASFRSGRLACLAALIAPLIALALWMISDNTISTPRVMQCALVLFAYLLLIFGSVRLLVAMRITPVLASFAVTALALAWLSWPIWLVAMLRGETQIVARLVWAHPLMAMNSVLRELGTWSTMKLAYHLTNLNQDVFYSLPPSIWPSVLLHGISGLVLWLVAWRVARRARLHRP